MRGIDSYRRSRTDSAPKHQIVLMLYQEVLSRLVRIGILLDAKASTTEWLPHVHHVREIFLELQGALDFAAAPELCGNLHNLYQWCMQEMIALGQDRELEHIVNVQHITTTLLDGWQHAVRQRGDL